MSRARIPPDDPLTAEIVRLYESGLSIYSITQACYLSKCAVRNRLINAGVKLRSKGRQPLPETRKEDIN